MLIQNDGFSDMRETHTELQLPCLHEWMLRMRFPMTSTPSQKFRGSRRRGSITGVTVESTVGICTDPEMQTSDRTALGCRQDAVTCRMRTLVGTARARISQVSARHCDKKQCIRGR